MPQANVLCLNSYAVESVMPPGLCCLRNIYIPGGLLADIFTSHLLIHISNKRIFLLQHPILFTLNRTFNHQHQPDSYLFESCHTTVFVHHRTASAHSCASLPETPNSGTRFSALPNGTEGDSEGRIISGFNAWRRGDRWRIW